MLVRLKSCKLTATLWLEMNFDKWDQRWADMAGLVSTWSKDPSTKVGAVIASGKKFISLGYNGPPAGVSDEAILRDRDTKLACTIHAEANAILSSELPVNGCTIYVTHYPCSGCAAMIVQKGIKRVVLTKPMDEGFVERWKASMEYTKCMFEDAGVSVVYK